MSVSNAGKHHLQGFFLLLGSQVELFLEELDGCLTQDILHHWQVRGIIHPDVSVVVPVVVIVFIGITANKANSMQEVVSRIVLYHSTYIVDSLVIPFVLHRLACRISSTENAYRFRAWQYDIAILIQTFHIAINDCRLEYTEEVTLTIYKIQ